MKRHVTMADITEQLPAKFQDPKFSGAVRWFYLAAQRNDLYNELVAKALDKFGSHGPLVSGVIRDHFPDEYKNVLRRHVHDVNELTDKGFADRPARVQMATMRKLRGEVEKARGQPRRANPMRKRRASRKKNPASEYTYTALRAEYPEFNRLTARHQSLVAADFSQAVETENMTIEQYRRNIGQGNLESYARTLAVVPKRGRRRNPNGAQVDEHAVRELFLFIENQDGMRAQKNSIIQNLTRKHARAQYDPAKAAKLWQYLIDEGVRRYNRDEAGGDYSLRQNIFSMADRRAAAKEFEETYRDGIQYDPQQNPIAADNMNSLTLSAAAFIEGLDSARRAELESTREYLRDAASNFAVPASQRAIAKSLQSLVNKQLIKFGPAKRNPARKKKAARKKAPRRRRNMIAAFTIARLRRADGGLEYWNGGTWGTLKNAQRFPSQAAAKRAAPARSARMIIAPASAPVARIRDALRGKA